MIGRIIEICAKNRMMVFIAVIFLVLGGLWSLKNVPLDAVPDLSDVQVIVYTEWPGRSPDLIEDQVTYPIVSAFISAPRVKNVRGFTDSRGQRNEIKKGRSGKQEVLATRR